MKHIISFSSYLRSDYFKDKLTNGPKAPLLLYAVLPLSNSCSFQSSYLLLDLLGIITNFPRKKEK